MLPPKAAAENDFASTPDRTHEAQDDSAALRVTVQRSLAVLAENGPKFFPKSGCVSCHNVSLPLIALSLARHQGYAEHAGAQQMVKQTIAALTPARDNLLSGYCSVPGFGTAVPYALISLHASGKPPDLLTDAMVRCLMVDQFADGSWMKHFDERPPIAPDTGIPATALSSYAMKLYAIPALQDELTAGIGRARKYLLSTKPRVGDDYAFRLLGLFWNGARQNETASAAKELVAQQRRDGGWGQTKDMDTDAYATGQALAALSMTQPSLVSTEAYRRGVAFLMRTRKSDGSWHVRSRAFGFQPYFESGFPHGRDQWISMAATAWATLALLPAAESL